jgi:putative endonuclease
MCRVHIFRSEKTGRCYVDITDNPERRLIEHNSGQTRSTKAGAPWRKFYSAKHMNLVPPSCSGKNG